MPDQLPEHMPRLNRQVVGEEQRANAVGWLNAPVAIARLIGIQVYTRRGRPGSLRELWQHAIFNLSRGDIEAAGGTHPNVALGLDGLVDLGGGASVLGPLAAGLDDRLHDHPK